MKIYICNLKNMLPSEYAGDVELLTAIMGEMSHYLYDPVSTEDLANRLWFIGSDAYALFRICNDIYEVLYGRPIVQCKTYLKHCKMFFECTVCGSEYCPRNCLNCERCCDCTYCSHGDLNLKECK